MNGKTYAYLDLAALPAVGAVLLSPRPAWVFASDGRTVLWANAAGAGLFGAASIGTLQDQRIGTANPLGKQVARLARTLPSAAPRLEILRYSAGFSLQALPAACQRLNLADGGSAVLAVAVGGEVASDSIAARATALAEAIADGACLAAVIGEDGRIVGASGGFIELSTASATIDGLVAEVAKGEARLAKQALTIDGTVRPAGAARFEEAGERLTLLVVGHADRMPTEADVAKNSDTAARPAEPVADAGAPPLTGGHQRTIRFLWQIDADQRITFVSPELAHAVGADHADIVGQKWADVGARLGLDADNRVQAALDRGAQWGGLTVTWPTAAGTGIAVTLSAFPVDDRGVFAGFRGLGILRADGGSRPGTGVSTAPVPGPVWEDERAASVSWEAGGTDSQPLVPAQGGDPGAARESRASDSGSPTRSRLLPTSSQDMPKSGTPDFGSGMSGVGGEDEVSAAGEGADSHPPVPSPGDLDDAARKSIEEGWSAAEGDSLEATAAEGDALEAAAAEFDLAAADKAAADTDAEAPAGWVEAGAASEPPAADDGAAEVSARGPSSNVVRLPGAASQPPPGQEPLSGNERDAFRRIAESLGRAGRDRGIGGSGETKERRLPSDGVHRPVSGDTSAPGGIASSDQSPRTGSQDEGEGNFAAAASSEPDSPSEGEAATASEGARGTAGEGAPPLDTAILDRLPIGLVVFRGAATLYANPALLDLLGYDRLDDFRDAGGHDGLFAGDADWTGRDAGTLFARRKDGGDVAVEARLQSVAWAGAPALMLTVREVVGDGAGAEDDASAPREAVPRFNQSTGLIDPDGPRSTVRHSDQSTGLIGPADRSSPSPSNADEAAFDSSMPKSATADFGVGEGQPASAESSASKNERGVTSQVGDPGPTRKGGASDSGSPTRSRLLPTSSQDMPKSGAPDFGAGMSGVLGEDEAATASEDERGTARQNDPSPGSSPRSSRGSEPPSPSRGEGERAAAASDEGDRREAAAADARMRALAEEVAAETARAGKLSDDLDAARKDLAATRENLAASRNDLAASRADLAASRDDLAGTRDRLGELEAILDTATDGVVVIEGDGTIGNLNRSAEALFGIEAADVVGLPFTDLFAEESRRAALDYVDGLAANGVASVLNDGREVIGAVPSGGLIPLFMTMGRLGRTGKFCAVLRDITHWKNVEEELVAARRAAETANSQKSEFLAKISHEIRTPLNAIIGFSEVMMEERFGPIGSARYRDYLRDIHISGTHLMSLINDLLDLSKIEAGKLELDFEAVALNGIIQESVALMQPQANRGRIIIRTSLAGSVPPVVADPRSLRQILLNLLSNAIKFTHEGGQVIVSTAVEENGEVAIRVRDTGVGMSAEDIETALKPFRQLATSNRDRGEGTGLGLPLTKALVEANRATFAIDSAVNQGTLVKVTFPNTRVLAG